MDAITALLKEPLTGQPILILTRKQAKKMFIDVTGGTEAAAALWIESLERK